MSEREAWMALREIGRELDRQTLRTIRGQLRAGDVDGAMRGIERIKEKNRGRQLRPE